MGEFFKGWRRKIGCITLVMACAFMAEWVRSYLIGDEIILSLGGKFTYETAISFNGRLGWWHYEIDDGFEDYARTDSGWRAFPLSEIRGDDVDHHLNWQLSVIGFRYGKYRPVKGVQITGRLISYWSVVMPLTLLSAYMLLVKARVAEPKIVGENPNPD